MKIYSKFQDYYDCALGSFTDSDVIVNRKQSTEKEKYIDMPDLVSFNGDWNYHGKGRYGGHIFGHTKIHMLGFCGTWYFYVWEKDENEISHLRYLTFDEIVKNNKTEGLFKWQKHQEFKNPNDEKYWQNLFEKYGPVLHCVYEPPGRFYIPYNTEKLNMEIDVWPNLKEHQFIQVKDPYTALWEIEHWFDSHARPDDAIVPVGDDVTRLKAYGFDAKTSFRKAKQK